MGYFSLMEDMMSCSTFWSVSVTRSTGELFSMTLMSFWRASRIIWQRGINDNQWGDSFRRLTPSVTLTSCRIRLWNRSLDYGPPVQTCVRAQISCCSSLVNHTLCWWQNILMHYLTLLGCSDLCRVFFFIPQHLQCIRCKTSLLRLV